MNVCVCRYSEPSIPRGSVSMELTNCEYSKNIPEIPKKQNLNLLHAKYHAESTPNEMILGIMSNLQIMENIQENMCRLNANLSPFYMRSLTICIFFVLRISWYQSYPSMPRDNFYVHIHI